MVLQKIKGKMKRGNFMKKQRKFYFILMVLFAMMFGLNSMAAPFPATIKNNVVYNVTARYYENHYHKFTVLQDGYITVYGYSKTKGSNKKYNLSIQLRKSEKRALYDYYTETGSYNKYRCYYALKKGTYCLAVPANNYAIKYTFTPVADKSGANQKKAATIKKGKVAEGLFTVGEKGGTKTRWFKIRLSKRQKVNLTFTTKTHGYMSCELISAKSKRVLLKSTDFARNMTEKMSTKTALPAGTYYIKVSNSGYEGQPLNASGYYSLCWK